jgi:uncharacterized protein YceK
METSATDTTVRQALLSVLLASLMMTAGCAGILSDESSSNGAGTATSTTTAGDRTNNTSSAGGVDLRSISIPDNGSVTRSGELDRGDPKNGNKYYEPVQVAAVEGQLVNITMRAENGNPGLRVVNPDGNVTAIISNESGTTTGIIDGQFAQTGLYTIEATSAPQNATFSYSLTFERVKIETESDELLAGPRSEYNETEQYLTFARDVALVTADVSDVGLYSLNATGTEFQSNVSGPDIQANASVDYAVITYEVGDSNALSRLNEIDTTFMTAYSNLWGNYQNLGNDTSTPEDKSWVPEIIFLRGLNESGELYRTHFITQDWARTYERTGNDDRYASQHGSTTRIGRGAPYNRSNYPKITTITDAEFPRAYRNYTFPDGTTLGERYGL